MDIYRAVEIFAESAESEKKVKDLGDDLSITQPLIEDVLSSMRGCKRTLETAIEKLESDRDNVFPEKLIQNVRDFSGHLSLLCNMILNGKSYSKEETRKAVQDEV